MFCGMGGFSFAAHKVGGVLVAACDTHATARKIFAHNHHLEPDTDIRTMPPVQNVDLLCAGFPCQPFSRAGERLGTKTENGRLFFTLLKYAKRCRIPCLLLENVADLVHVDEGRVFIAFLAALERAGYQTSFALLTSADFGVPQVRERLYIVAHRTRLFSFNRLEARPRARPPFLPSLDPDLSLCRSLRFDLPYTLPPVLTPMGAWRCDQPFVVSQPHRIYHPKGPIATLLASSSLKIYDPRLGMVRKLTGREMLASQGFPTTTFPEPLSLSHSAMMHLCGNAVSVPVVEAILREMIRQGLFSSSATT